MRPDLVLIGNLLIDDVVFADGRTHMGQAGGAMLYASLAAALWSTRVGVASVRGNDYPAVALDALARRGVALDGVREIAGPGLRMWLLYEGRVRRVVHRLTGPSHDAVSPRPHALPAEWRDARAFHLAPMPLPLQLEWVRTLEAQRP